MINSPQICNDRLFLGGGWQKLQLQGAPQRCSPHAAAKPTSSPVTTVFMHFPHPASTALQICPRVAMPWPAGRAAVPPLPTFFPQPSASATACGPCAAKMAPTRPSLRGEEAQRATGAVGKQLRAKRGHGTLMRPVLGQEGALPSCRGKMDEEKNMLCPVGSNQRLRPEGGWSGTACFETHVSGAFSNPYLLPV